MGSVIKMYGGVAGGTENGIAQIDIPAKGSIVGCQWAVRGDLDADLEQLDVQLSFRSAGQFSTNDDRGIISEIRNQSSLTTSGTIKVDNNVYVSLPDIPVAAGERLYLHATSTSGVTANVSCLLHLSFDGERASSRRI